MMKSIYGVILVIAALVVPGSASAATLVTPALFTDANVNYIRCFLTNVGMNDLKNVEVDVVDGFGNVKSKHTAITVHPGTTYTDSFGYDSLDICRFAVPAKNKVRAGGCVADFGTATCDTEVEAR